MPVWDDVITERDKLVYNAAGFGQKRIGFGQKPALIIIDVTYAFVGDKPEPIMESIKRFPNSCGEEGWAAVRQIASLLPVVREKNIPVIYTASDTVQKPSAWTSWKSSRMKEENRVATNQIVREISPSANDILVYKSRASIFYGTPLLSILISLRADTLLVCGCTTSGCVRASAIDAWSSNFKVAVIEECVFDRAQTSHKINLFDMNAKYADVVSVSDIKEYIAKL
ncbi:MAG: isochorismatase family protein [Chloroflexi bacterium]|nr:isochorismatase family protein [Chloroflexota bacterium]